MTWRGIVVMAHAGSGSNSLVEILNLAHVKPLVNEPFNENFTTWSAGNPDYLGRVTDEGSLDAVVDEILEAWSGLKILSYQLEVPLLRQLLLRPEVDVVFLRRRNLLEAVVSNLVAIQTNLWKTWDADGPIEPRYLELAPLAIDEVRGFVGWHQTRLAEIESAWDPRRLHTLEVRMEHGKFKCGPDAEAVSARVA